MKEAINLATEAYKNGEVPVAAIIVDPADNSIVSTAYNLTEKNNDPTAHAEIIAIREAGQIIGSPRLTGFDMYVTLEPCAMCAAAISFARIRRLYFGAFDIKMGGVENGVRYFNSPACNHSTDVYGGIMEPECSKLLKSFFEERR